MSMGSFAAEETLETLQREIFSSIKSQMHARMKNIIDAVIIERMSKPWCSLKLVLHVRGQSIVGRLGFSG